MSLDKVVLLDKIQKGLPITKDAAVLLRRDKLIEGRSPNYYVSSHIASTTGFKAEYIKNRAFDKAWYKDLIIELIKKYKQASRKDIDDLLMDRMSNLLDTKQKKTKIRNLLYEMSKKDKTIYNRSKSKANPEWALMNNKSDN